MTWWWPFAQSYRCDLAASIPEHSDALSSHRAMRWRGSPKIMKEAAGRAEVLEKVFRKKMQNTCAADRVLGDHKNIADLALPGALIKSEKRDDRARWERSRMLGVVAGLVAKVPPKTRRDRRRIHK